MFFSWTKRKPIHQIVEGEIVAVEGKVVAKAQITAIGAQTKCVYYTALLESFKTGPRGRGRKMWVPERAEQRCAGFFVDDGTCKIWITDKTDGFDVKCTETASGILGKKGRQRYWVSLIRDGQTVRVVGQASGPKGAEPGDCLVMRADPKGRLRIRVKKG